MKHLSSATIFFILFLIMLSGCQDAALNPEQEILSTKELTNYPILGEEYLKFEDESQFQAYRQQLQDAFLEGKSYEQTLTEVGDFISFAEAYEAISDEDYLRIAQAFWNNGSLAGFENLIAILPEDGRHYEEVEVVAHPLMRHLLNRDAMIQVGDQVQKYTFNHIVSVKASDHSAVQALKSVNDQNLGSFSYSHNLKEVTRSSLPSANEALRYSTVADCKKTYGSNDKYRVKGIIEWYGGGYSGQTKHQKKTLGIWFGKKTSSLRVQATGTVQWGSDTETVNVDVTDNDKKKTAKYALSHCGTYCLRGPADIDATHTAVATCNISYSY
jgi:hypothetical protein